MRFIHLFMRFIHLHMRFIHLLISFIQLYVHIIQLFVRVPLLCFYLVISLTFLGPFVELLDDPGLTVKLFMLLFVEFIEFFNAIILVLCVVLFALLHSRIYFLLFFLFFFKKAAQNFRRSLLSKYFLLRSYFVETIIDAISSTLYFIFTYR